MTEEQFYNLNGYVTSSKGLFLDVPEWRTSDFLNTLAS